MDCGNDNKHGCKGKIKITKNALELTALIYINNTNLFCKVNGRIYA